MGIYTAAKLANKEVSKKKSAEVNEILEERLKNTSIYDRWQNQLNQPNVPIGNQLKNSIVPKNYSLIYDTWDGTGGEHDTSAGDLEDYGREEQKNNFATPEDIANKKAEFVSKSEAGSAPSQNVSNAMALLQELRNRQYADPYGKQLEELINSWNNREPFSYELEADPLYQMAKENAMYMGDVAMRDTIGKVTAMSGGYGNSYAQTAGQQAYNAYLQELNSQAPDFYAAAYEKYKDEDTRLLNEINNVNTLRKNDYSLWEDAYKRELDAIGAALDSENEAGKLAWEQSKWLTEKTIDAASKGLDYDPDTGKFKKTSDIRASWSDSEYEGATKAFLLGGEEALEFYVENLVADGLDPEKGDTLAENIKKTNKDSIGTALSHNAPVSQSIAQGLWNVDSENDGGINWGWGINQNRKYINPFTNESISVSALKALLVKEGFSEKEAEDYIKNNLPQGKY